MRSATAMRPPSGDQATDMGSLNVPLAAPSDPNSVASVPFGWSRRMRWLARSATAMRSPSGEYAIEGMNPPNVTFVAPPEPNTSASVPFAWNSWMRRLSSATAMRPPSGDQATARGVLNALLPLS